MVLLREQNLKQFKTVSSFLSRRVRRSGARRDHLNLGARFLFVVVAAVVCFVANRTRILIKVSVCVNVSLLRHCRRCNVPVFT